MPRPFAYWISPAGTRPVAAPVAALATAGAALAMLGAPAASESASIWSALAMVAPASVHSLFALSCALLAGIVAWLSAEAFAQRSLRPALLSALAGALLAPAALAVPLWPPLLAAAALIASPAPPRRRAANDNPIPAHRAAHPFSLAA